MGDEKELPGRHPTLVAAATALALRLGVEVPALGVSGAETCNTSKQGRVRGGESDKDREATREKHTHVTQVTKEE